MEKIEEIRGFALGWSQVPVGMMDVMKRELIDQLSIRNRMMWWRRLNGKGCSPLSKAEIHTVETIFKKIGITDVWGEVSEQKAASRLKSRESFS